MLLIEIALHNVLGLSQLIRIKPKSGLNLIQGDNGSGKTTIQRSLFALLSPASDCPDFRQGQAGIILRATDGQVYRLVRDFSKEKSSLARRDPEGRYQPVAQDEAKVLQFILEDTRGLQSPDLRTVFLMTRAGMPGWRFSPGPKGIAPSNPSSSMIAGVPPTPRMEAAAPAVDREKTRARIEEIQRILEKADQASVLEDQAGELRLQSTDLQRRLKLAGEKTAALNELERKDKPLHQVWPLAPDDLHALEQYSEQIAVRDDQIKSLNENREEIQASIDAIPSQPLYLTPLFVSGAGVVVLSFIVPQFVPLEGMAGDLLFLPIVLGIGLMGWAAVRDFQRLGHRKLSATRIQHLAKQQEGIEADFLKHTARARELLEKSGCAGVDAFKRKMGEREIFESLLRETAAERDRLFQGRTVDAIQNELRAVEERLLETEESARAMAGLAADVYMLQEELRRLENELSQSEAPPPAPEEPPAAMDSFTPFSEEPRVESLLPNGLRELLQKEPLKSRLLSKIQPLNTAIRHWFGRFPRTKSIRITLNEDLTVALFSDDGANLSPDRLSTGLLDAAYFVCHVAIAGLLSVAHPFPLILDDPIASLDAGNQQIALDILREIAQNKQVLLMTTQTLPGKEGDGVIALPRP